MRSMVPGIAQVDNGAGVIVSVTEHGMVFHVNEHRPAGIDLSLVLGKAKPGSPVAVD